LGNVNGASHVTRAIRDILLQKGVPYFGRSSSNRQLLPTTEPFMQCLPMKFNASHRLGVGTVEFEQPAPVRSGAGFVHDI
jgi:hypothetical protein